MTIAAWLKAAQDQLVSAGIGTARLDCLVLLEDETQRERSWLLAHPEYKLQIEQIKNLSTKIDQRTHHEPLAYIRGKTEFYGREFAVDPHVLEPRPESETTIEFLTSLDLPSKATIIDIGTGSGALAITAKLELPGSQVLAIDIDLNCLKIAENNAKQLHADISFLQGNLLQPLRTQEGKMEHATLVCNLPYVPDSFHINHAAMHEPSLAIFGGPDGLDLYRQLFSQLQEYGWRPLYILAESLPPQHAQLADIAAMAGFRLTDTNDFIQLYQPAT